MWHHGSLLEGPFHESVCHKLKSKGKHITQPSLPRESTDSVMISFTTWGWGYSWEFLVGLCRPVLPILTRFQTKECNNIILSTPIFRVDLYNPYPFPRLQVVSHFSSPHARKGDTWQGKRKMSRVSPFSCVAWFLHALVFRSLYYPWGKMGDYS